MGGKGKWIQGAVSPENKGKFTKKAKKAGKSVAAFAKMHAGDSGKLGREARFAKTMRAIARKHKHARS
jgi:hypothetical protein